MTYRTRPEPAALERRSHAICRRIDKATFIWLPLLLVGSFTMDGVSFIFMMLMLTKTVVWLLLDINPLTCRPFGAPPT